MADIAVTFTTCDREKTTRETTMRRKREESNAELIQRAVRKVYGRSCHWWRDSGLGLYYGQVVKGSNCVTARVRVDLEGEG